MTRSLPRLAALLSVLLAFGCSALPEMDFNPLIRVEHMADGATEIEALGPFVAWRSGDDGVSHALRPLYQHKANHGYAVTDWLAPFGKRFVVEGGTRWRFWPLVWSGTTRDSPEGEEWDMVVFPIIFTGTGPNPGDGYFALWPLGGRIRNVFGIETYDFFLWPLFMRTQMEITEQSTSWTIFLGGGWVDGGPRDGSWRALPFYRHRLERHADGRPRTDQQTVLWPFFTWGTSHEDTASPGERVAFWPLFSWEQSDTWLRTSWLWPFFRWNRQTDPTPDEGGEFRYDLPWPFFLWRRDDSIEHFRIWPFYSHQEHSDGLDSTNILLIWWWRHMTGRTLETDPGEPPQWPSRAYERHDSYFIPFWHRGTRTVEGREGRDHVLQLWPLFHSDSHIGGREHDAFLSLVPTRHYEFLRGADELYSPFWTLWRRRAQPGATETRLLFDTTLWRRSEEGLRISIPFLYSRVPSSPEVSGHRFLWGLFGTRTDADGLATFNILGIPLWQR